MTHETPPTPAGTSPKVFDPVEQERQVQRVHAELTAELSAGKVSDELLFAIRKAGADALAAWEKYRFDRKDAMPTSERFFLFEEREEWRRQWPTKSFEEFFNPAVREVLEKWMALREPTHEEKVAAAIATGKYRITAVSAPEPRVSIGDIVQLDSPREHENGKVVLIVQEDPGFPGQYIAREIDPEDMPKTVRKVKVASTTWYPKELVPW